MGVIRHFCKVNKPNIYLFICVYTYFDYLGPNLVGSFKTIK